MRRWLWLLSLGVITRWGQTKAVGPPAPPPSPDENRANLILNEALASKNPDVRKQAVAALGLIGPREPYISEIAAALSDKDVYVRLSAVASIVDLKDKGTADLLNKALGDPTPEVSFAAAKALFGSGRATTAVLLANDPSPEVLSALKEALTDKDGSVRAAVVHALALRNDRSMLPLMKEQFDDASEGVRLRAAAAYLRLVWLKTPPPAPPKRTFAKRTAAAPQSRPKKQQP